MPTYEAQQLHAHIKDFEEQLLQLRAQSAPKKRFSFARKPAPAPSQKGEARKNERHEPGSQAPAQGQGSCKPERSQSGRDTSVEGASKAQQHVRTSLASAYGSGSSRQASGSKGGEHSSTPAALSAAPLPASSNRYGSDQYAQHVDGAASLLLGYSPPLTLESAVQVPSAEVSLRYEALGVCRCISTRMHKRTVHTLEGDGRSMVIRSLTSHTVCVRGRLEALRMCDLVDCTAIKRPSTWLSLCRG